MRGGGSASSVSGDAPFFMGGHEERSGWLQKWTNYLKGYRQRWFVLDSHANLSYYRNQSEVGQSCRGSINLQEARIHTDSTTNSLTISASSQTFHLKAQNECDRQQWLTALEYARHRAIRAAESDEDEDIKLNSLSDGGGMTAVETINQALAAKLEDLRTCNTLITKHGGELLKLLGEVEQSEKKRALSERIGIFKISAAAMMNACDEFVVMSSAESRRLGRYAANEHEQRLRLQNQLEELAQQHSSLERAAYRTARENSEIASELPFFESDDEFHDACDKMSDSNADDRKSNSSHTESVCDETERRLFDAEIVTRGESVDQIMPVQQPKPLSVANSGVAHSSLRVRRSRVPDRPNVGLNLWSIMRNCIGRDLSRIPMPVNFNEPLSVLQRITEDLEYSHLLDSAAELSDSCEQMCYVAAYAVSSYSTTGNRTTKPFNPLLGETYECDRSADLGWRSFAEQVCHHPPITAHHADGRKWTLHQDFAMTSRFRGKYLSVIPTGYSHLKFHDQEGEYSFKKVTTTVHNIIVGKLWIDNHGEMVIENHTTGDKCFLKFHAYSYFSREPPRKVTGLVRDSNGKLQWIIQGTWDRSLDMLKVTKGCDKGDKSILETEAPRRIWAVNPPHPGCEKMYYFTKLAVELNEPEEGVAPTDSRLRPDQRLMEEGRWDESNRAKLEIEEKQRAERRRRETLAEKAMQSGEPCEEYHPLWFVKTQDEVTGAVVHAFTGEYWEKKKIGDWSACPNIF